MLHYFKNNTAGIEVYRNDCIVCFDIIQNSLIGYEEKLDILKMEKMKQILMGSRNDILKNLITLQKFTLNLKSVIKLDIETRWCMVFLPYKASMWTSMESIWKAAIDDPNCDTYVIPIPYRSLMINGQTRTDYYEGNQFPEYVPILDYKTTSLAEMNPEFIFIHNPYDEYNNLTRLPEEYYSKNLKQFTPYLIYSPYFTFFSSEKEDYERLVKSAAANYCDYIILQSQKIKNMFLSCGYSSKKLIVNGSPKIDAIVNMNIESPEIPKLWKRKFKNRKVILYTFSLAAAYYKFWLEAIISCMKSHWRDDEVAFIFRPHPLTLDYCYGRNINIEEIEEIFRIAETDERFVLDTNESYLPAFYFSDGFMMSDSSSLLNEYLATGKPIYWDKMNFDNDSCILKNKYKFPVDTTALYCPRVINDADTDMSMWQGIADFFNVIKTGTDSKKIDRLKAYQDAFLNFDGTAGEHIYQNLTKKLLSRYDEV